jgi:hypothetical protein
MKMTTTMIGRRAAKALGRCPVAHTRLASTSSMGAPGNESFYQFNWLDEGCGDVPAAPRALDLETSEMLRGGHALQVASASLIDGQVQSGDSTSSCV